MNGVGTQIGRRGFLGLAAAGLHGATMPIVDTHIHLFDPRRPQGIPWPEKKDKLLYRPALPERYGKIAKPLGIRGYIVVEASPVLEDNQWVLDTAAKDPFFLGTVGSLRAGAPGFAGNLERFRRNPLFLGVRFGNIWGWNLTTEIASPAFLADMKKLADAGLAMDSADPDPALIAAIVRLTDRVPTLRVVIDHLPQLQAPQEQKARAAFMADLRELGKRPQVFGKISEVPRRVDGRVPTNLSYYKAGLDELWDIFGEDRLMYGSDWPNSDTWGPYSLALKLVTEYFATKGQAATEKYFWKNSIAAYRWVKRDPGQPSGK